ncbi:MAG TPA: MFS transporter [Verrucomicrobiota bacterium]|nr:hypothetical protein [Verrucomicrobiales bacterium]HRI11918.1 MFS transporter [Verrucomicrobiota bacterium]
MRSSPSKVGYYVLEGINSFATAYFFNYLMFLLRDGHGFNNLNNLTVAALHGLTYIPASLFGGRFGQRHGKFLSLRIGFSGMAIAILLGWAITGLGGQLLALGLWTVALCFTWPVLEALVSEHEPAERLPNRVGLYNIIWAGMAALAFSTGGWIFQHLGATSLYWLPVVLNVAMLVATWPLERRHDSWAAQQPTSTPRPLDPELPVRPRYFQQLAWLANPFNYMALNTVIALAPGLADRAGLGLAQAGVVLSVWFYVRALAFLKLWLWAGWHYRFDWFIGAFVLLLLSYVVLVQARTVPVLVVAQVGLGWASALLYYSSLYYSMDGSETHSEHGGIHEALIGAGICAGPGLSAAGLWLTGQPAAPAWVVAGALAAAIAGSWQLRRRAFVR